MEKTKKKERKSHHLKPPGACGPASPGFLRSRARPLGLGSLDFSVYVCIPSQVGGHQSSFLQSRDRKKSRSNSETKNLFPSRHLFLLPPSLLRLTLASVSPPGACTSLLPQDRGPVYPFPPHWPRGGTPHTQRCFCQDGCAVPSSSCLLYIASGTLGWG